jgi:hypothetical protein
MRNPTICSDISASHVSSIPFGTGVASKKSMKSVGPVRMTMRNGPDEAVWPTWFSASSHIQNTVESNWVLW